MFVREGRRRCPHGSPYPYPSLRGFLWYCLRHGPASWWTRTDPNYYRPVAGENDIRGDMATHEGPNE
jgi:hypothetical protein